MTSLPQVSQDEYGSRFSKLDEIVKKWFAGPDLEALHIILAAARAHHFKCSDPIWMLIVGPSGCAKTCLYIMAVSELPEVQMLGHLTPAALLSGPAPGILEELGPPMREGDIIRTRCDAIFLVNDLTSILCKPKIVVQLLQIHDGFFSRSFRTGITKEWRGRVSLIAATTPTIDNRRGKFRELGERFVQIRIPRPPKEAGPMAAKQCGHKTQIKRDIKAAVMQLFIDS